MSSAPYPPGADDWPLLLDVLERHRQRLVARTAELWAVLTGLPDGSTGSDVQGYLACGATPPLAATERAELAAGLQANSRLLQGLATRLDQLRALVEASPEAR